MARALARGPLIAPINWKKGFLPVASRACFPANLIRSKRPSSAAVAVLMIADVSVDFRRSTDLSIAGRTSSAPRLWKYFSSSPFLLTSHEISSLFTSRARASLRASRFHSRASTPGLPFQFGERANSHELSRNSRNEIAPSLSWIFNNIRRPEKRRAMTLDSVACVYRA